MRSCSIEPGFFRTEISRNAARGDRTPSLRRDPYAGDQAWLADFFDKSVVDGGGDPGDVAEAIVRAAYDPTTPVHNLVGDDAFMLIDLYRQAGSIEAWLPVAVSFAESVAGPRPPRSQTD